MTFITIKEMNLSDLDKNLMLKEQLIFKKHYFKKTEYVYICIN